MKSAADNMNTTGNTMPMDGKMPMMKIGAKKRAPMKGGKEMGFGAKRKRKK